MDIVKEWNLVKIGAYLEALQEITYQPGQTIYAIGDPSENVFTIVKGKVELEVFFLVYTSFNIPVKSAEYHKKCTS